ncbi:MAG: DNA topoisomerase 3 [Clostridiales bacterium]|nr:DNA topoisomerase 3 [Bacillota bacterium]NLL54467.1 DNA topoisomerase 3 [Clostridiales bacterium]
MILVVAEKPSVARDIARVLGCSVKGDGFLSGKDYHVTWALGHLVGLCDPAEVDPRYKKWDFATLPILPETLPTKVLPKTRKQYGAVKKLMLDPEVDRIICATDSGREGELIFRFIYLQAGCRKPVDRLWISSMTDAAIREGFAGLKPSEAYDALYTSARCRAEADWLVGMNASRAFSLKYDALLSMGRVQTPTLHLIVQRDLEIRDFVPQTYYEIRADFGDYEGLWVHPETKETRCPDQDKAREVVRQVKGKTGAVEQLISEKKRTPPPQLFDLTALQREANRLMGLSAARTLEIAQALYEKHKLITYPRTDSRYLTRDMIPKVAKTLGSLPEPWGGFAAPLLPKPPVTGRVYNDAKVSDHHAIVPTGQYGSLSRLTAQEARVFDMVARRLVAVLYPDYEYQSTQIFTRVEQHLFKTMGQTPLVPGWRALYPSAKPEDKEQQPLPQLKEGDTRAVQKVSSKACKTKPPSPHTDASLLGLMEHAGRLIEDEELRESMKASGLGTPATRAAIIERLIKVEYVKRSGKTLRATEKGIRLTQVTPPQLASAETTGRWERALTQMASESDPAALAQRSERFMDSIRRFSAFLVEAAIQADGTVQFEPDLRKGKGGPRKSGNSDLGVPCPLCGEGNVTANQKAFGCTRWRESCKFTIWRDALKRHGGPNLTIQHMKKLLGGEQLSLDGIKLYLDGPRLVAEKERPDA